MSSGNARIPKSKNGKHRLLRYFFRALSLVFFVGASALVWRQARQYDLDHVIASLRGYGLRELGLSGLFTVLTYWLLTGYDALSFLYTRHHISYLRVVFVAFISYAFSNNIGMANIAGAAMRFRLYARWKIPRAIVARVVALNILSTWMGFLTVGGLFFTFASPRIPPEFHLPFESAWPVGVVCLTLVAGYFAAALFAADRFRLPRGPVFASQILIGFLDFAFGGFVLYYLLPTEGPLMTDWSYGKFFGSFLMAQLAGIISHVPGGLGVFEGVMLLELGSVFAGPDILAALFAYRVIFFLSPLIVAGLAYATLEVRDLAH